MTCKVLSSTVRGTLCDPALGVLLDASRETCCQWHRARPLAMTPSSALHFNWTSASVRHSRLPSSIQRWRKWCFSERRVHVCACQTAEGRPSVRGCSLLCFGLDKHTVSKTTRPPHLEFTSVTLARWVPFLFLWHEVKLSFAFFHFQS